MEKKEKKRKRKRKNGEEKKKYMKKSKRRRKKIERKRQRRRKVNFCNEMIHARSICIPKFAHLFMMLIQYERVFQTPPIKNHSSDAFFT